ncbi:arginine--tRNA ligase [Patescibacteria group bacterium]
MIKDELEKIVINALGELGIEAEDVLVERPDEVGHGDFATNVAMVYAKQIGKNPKELANEIVSKIQLGAPSAKLEKVEIAGPGFINFYLKDEVFIENLKEVLEKGDEYGKNSALGGKKIMFEYTDPNPFKPFHIGHLMTNAIGESLARILEFSGAEMRRANYQGDIGRHVAMAIWGLQQKGWDGSDVAQNGEAYAYGNKMFEKEEKAKKEILELNKYLYERFGEEKSVDEIYKTGRKVSLEHFDELYKTLGTKFDYLFFESDTWKKGKEVVEKNIDGVFEKSEGAIIFDGEKYGLHKRVFINSEGLTTYEAKDIGLAYAKSEAYKADEYITVTAVEQQEYFKVVFKALELLQPDFAGKFKSVTHGMMQFTSGKMSSRKGNVITGESLLGEAQEVAHEKMKDSGIADAEKISEQIAVAAVKYAILKQTIGKNIIYNEEQALSFEGDSGPYLQYTHARTKSILRKANYSGAKSFDGEIGAVEKKLLEFPEVVLRAQKEYAPHYITGYLIELAREFNSYYANNQIIGSEEEEYRLALTQAVAQVLENGLTLLGIEAPEQM